MRHVLSNVEKVAHEFIYDNENWYAGPMSNRTCFASGDYVFNWRLDDYHKQIRRENANDILRNNWLGWGLDQYCVIIINREEKIMLVNTVNDDNNVAFEFKWALPEDWKVVYVSEPKLDDPDILKKKHRRKFYELIVKNSIKKALFYCSNEFEMAFTDYRPVVMYYNPWKNNRFNDLGASVISDIIPFLDDIPEDIKNKKLVKEYVFRVHHTVNGEYMSKVTLFDVPTLQDVLSGNILKMCAYKTFLQKAVYAHFKISKLGIKWKNFLYYWDTAMESYNDILMHKLYSYFTWKSAPNEACLRAKTFRDDWKARHHTEPKWQDILRVYYTVLEEEIDELNISNKKLSKVNKAEALKIYHNKSEKECILSWRNGVYNDGRNNIKYNTWIPADFTSLGKWFEITENVCDYLFMNTQLKMYNPDTIITSRYCEVPLDDAVNMYRFFKVNLKREPNRKHFNFTDRKIKCGRYTLNWFKYTTKITDLTNESLNKEEWCVCIGCHHIWMDDFYDFVHYYNLEDRFGIE